MHTINKEALEYSELNQYNLSDYDEGGYLGINEEEFAKHLINFASKSKFSQLQNLEGQRLVLINLQNNLLKKSKSLSDIALNANADLHERLNNKIAGILIAKEEIRRALKDIEEKIKDNDNIK